MEEEEKDEVDEKQLGKADHKELNKAHTKEFKNSRADVEEDPDGTEKCQIPIYGSKIILESGKNKILAASRKIETDWCNKHLIRNNTETGKLWIKNPVQELSKNAPQEIIRDLYNKRINWIKYEEEIIGRK